MKKLSFFIFLICFINQASAQQTNIEFYPPNPTATDSIMVVMDFSFQFVNCDFGVVTHSYYLVDDKIDIYSEFCPADDMQDSTYCITSDTLIIPPISANNYSINVYVGMTGQCPIGNAYYSLDTLTTTLQVDVANSINEFSNQEIQIFPNPTKDHLNIEIESGQHYLLRISNSIGQVVLTRRLSNNTNPVSLKEFSKGIYFLEFEGLSGGKQIVKKVIVK